MSLAVSFEIWLVARNFTDGVSSTIDALELMFVGIGFVTVPLAIIIYSRINAKRDALEKEMKEKGIKLSDDEIRRLGDRAPDFRYTL